MPPTHSLMWLKESKLTNRPRIDQIETKVVWPRAERGNAGRPPGVRGGWGVWRWSLALDATSNARRLCITMPSGERLIAEGQIRPIELLFPSKWEQFLQLYHGLIVHSAG